MKINPAPLPYDQAGLPFATVQFDQDGTPESQTFSDIYHHRAQGLAETRHVFLEQNFLPERWQKNSLHTIAELGFGTGLNFLATWDLWNQSRRETQRLTYVSIEMAPLSPAALQRALSPWVELRPLARMLEEQYPPPVAGIHQLHFPGIDLTLVFGRAEDYLPRLAMRADTWFFDGFSPAKNPELWTKEVIAHAAALSNPGARFATYSSAAAVRRAFAEAGFTVEKVPGFGRKREMIRGELPGASPEREGPRSVVIVGAGLAGATAAESFARRGCSVTLIERHPRPGMGASGNLAGVTMPYTAKIPDRRMRLTLTGFLYSKRLLESIERAGLPTGWNPTGILRFPTSDRLRRMMSAISETGLPEDFLRYVNREEASEIAGARTANAALYFAAGGAVSPVTVCQQLVQRRPGLISLLLQTEAIDFTPCEAGWRVTGEEGRTLAEGEALVIAAASDLTRFPLLSNLPVKKLRGQVAHISGNEFLSRIQSSLCYDGYLARSNDGSLVMGSSFEHGNDSLELDQDTQRSLVRRLKKWLPDFNAPEGGTLPGKVGFRATVPDRIPIVGPIPGEEMVKESAGSPYKQLTFDLEDSRWRGNLYVTAGHGSQGLISAPLTAELIASIAFREPLPVDSELLHRLNAMRFLI